MNQWVLKWFHFSFAAQLWSWSSPRDHDFDYQVIRCLLLYTLRGYAVVCSGLLDFLISWGRDSPTVIKLLDALECLLHTGSQSKDSGLGGGGEVDDGHSKLFQKGMKGKLYRLPNLDYMPVTWHTLATLCSQPHRGTMVLHVTTPPTLPGNWKGGENSPLKWFQCRSWWRARIPWWGGAPRSWEPYK